MSEDRKPSEALLKHLERVRVIAAAKVQENKAERQIAFLDAFWETQKFVDACKKIDIDQGVVCNWALFDEEFREAYDQLKQMRDVVREEQEEDALHDTGVGLKEMKMPQVVAAKMGLVARNRKRWSEKIDVEKTNVTTITTIVKHYDSGQEVIDAPSVKVLTDGSNREST